MKTILAVDFNEWACLTYRANFPYVPIRRAMVGDIIGELPRCDILVGGPPCQPFSLAGKGEGDDDARDGIPDFIAAIRKTNCRMFLMENVAGLLTSAHWPYFQRIYTDMEKCGYVIQHRLLDAVNFGVPQFRKRVWVWGIRSDLHAQGMRHQWPLPTHAWPWPEPSMFGGELLPAVTVGWALNIPHMQADGEWFAGHTGHTGHTGHILRRTANPKSPQYFPINEPADTVLSSSPQFHRYVKAGGNIDANGRQGGGCPPVIEAGTMQSHGNRSEVPFEFSRPSDALRGAVPGCSDARVIEYRWSDEMLAKHPPASPASTVKANWAKCGAEGLVECVIDEKHPFQSAESPASIITSGGSGHGPTGNSINLAIDTKQNRTRRPVRARQPTVASDSRHELKAEGRGLVRRLTPDECSRLQSMPDDFQWPCGISKTNRYRIIGNGQASLMVWRLRRAMEAVDPASETVIDLFCGGGVGAVGWHGRYFQFNPNTVK